MSERAHKVRKASVSFDSSMTGRPAAAAAPAVKHGRKLVTAQMPNRYISSAGSGVSTASTWSVVNRPASSMMALRSRILITIERAIMLITEYQQRYLTNPDDDLHGIYQEFVKQLLARIGYKTDLVNPDHLDSVIIKKFQSDPTIAKRSDFKALAEVCRRAKGFRELRSQVQSRIDEVFNYADNFCIPFSHEAEGYSFEAVEQYENTKTECLREINQSMENAQASSEGLRDIQPLSTYLESYSRVLHHIEHVVHCLLCVAKNLKRWIIADEQYEHAIEREMATLKHKSKMLTGDRVGSSSLKYEVRARTSNETGKLRKLDLALSRYRHSQAKLKEQQKLLSKSLSDVKESQRIARRELADLERQSTRRLRPAELSLLVPAADKVNEKIQILQQKEDCIVARINSVDSKIASTIKEIHLLEGEKGRRRKSAEVVIEHVKEQKTALKQQENANQSLIEKLRVLHKLKSLKQDHGVLRKMEFNMTNIDYKEAMQAAIRDIAPQAGNHWPEIYMKLPFLPPRQAKKLESDILDIQQSGISASRSETDMAIQAFEKWAKRSTSATVNELLFATKPYREVATKRELSKREKFTVPRIKKRFQQLKIKPDVVYV